MATIHIESKQQKAQRGVIEAELAAGKLPMPPSLKKGKAFHHGLGAAADWFDKFNAPPTDHHSAEARERRIAVVEADKARVANEWAEQHIGKFDETCGMESREAFEWRLIKACFIDDLRKARQGTPYIHKWAVDVNITKADRILMILRLKRLNNYLLQKIEPPVFEPLPSPEREDALDKAAEAKWKVRPAKINELLEAVHVAIAHPGNAEAQCLPDGFTLRQNAHIWHLVHPAIERAPVVATRLDEADTFRDVVRRGDVRDCLIALRESVAAKKEARNGGMTTVGAAAKAAVEELAAKKAEKAKVARPAVTGPYSHGFVDVTGKVWGL